jgi:hypothetical protein
MSELLFYLLIIGLPLVVSVAGCWYCVKVDQKLLVDHQRITDAVNRGDPRAFAAARLYKSRGGW